MQNFSPSKKKILYATLTFTLHSSQLTYLLHAAILLLLESDVPEPGRVANWTTDVVEGKTVRLLHNHQQYLEGEGGKGEGGTESDFHNHQQYIEGEGGKEEWLHTH